MRPSDEADRLRRRQYQAPPTSSASTSSEVIAHLPADRSRPAGIRRPGPERTRTHSRHLSPEPVRTGHADGKRHVPPSGFNLLGTTSLIIGVASMKNLSFTLKLLEGSRGATAEQSLSVAMGAIQLSYGAAIDSVPLPQFTPDTTGLREPPVTPGSATDWALRGRAGANSLTLRQEPGCDRRIRFEEVDDLGRCLLLCPWCWWHGDFMIGVSPVRERVGNSRGCSL